MILRYRDIAFHHKRTPQALPLCESCEWAHHCDRVISHVQFIKCGRLLLSTDFYGNKPWRYYKPVDSHTSQFKSPLSHSIHSCFAKMFYCSFASGSEYCSQITLFTGEVQTANPVIIWWWRSRGLLHWELSGGRSWATSTLNWTDDYYVFDRAIWTFVRVEEF